LRRRSRAHRCRMISAELLTFVILTFASTISAPAEVSPTREELLVQAAREGRAGEVALLVAMGANINHRDRRAPASDEDKPGSTALTYAAFHGDVETTRLLIDKRADPNIVGDDGETPLSAAVRSGELNAVTSLLERGALLRP
jgi:hypothetical protein